MDGLHFLHIVVLGLWGGCLLVEVLIELRATRNQAWQELVADLHYYIDLFIELPLLIAILITGFLLLPETMSSLLVAKVAAGLAAVGLNLFCVVAVILRKRAKDSSDPRYQLYHKLTFSSAVGFVPGVAALYLGLRSMGMA